MLFVAFLLAWGTLITVLRAGTLDVFWDWFLAGSLAPFYQQLPDVSFVDALGLSLVISFLVTTKIEDEDPAEDKFEYGVKLVVKTVVWYGFVWLIALVIRAVQS